MKGIHALRCWLDQVNNQVMAVLPSNSKVSAHSSSKSHLLCLAAVATFLNFWSPMMVMSAWLSMIPYMWTPCTSIFTQCHCGRLPLSPTLTWRTCFLSSLRSLSNSSCVIIMSISLQGLHSLGGRCRWPTLLSVGFALH